MRVPMAARTGSSPGKGVFCIRPGPNAIASPLTVRTITVTPRRGTATERTGWMSARPRCGIVGAEKGSAQAPPTAPGRPRPWHRSNHPAPSERDRARRISQARSRIAATASCTFRRSRNHWKISQNNAITTSDRPAQSFNSAIVVFVATTGSTGRWRREERSADAFNWRPTIRTTLPVPPDRAGGGFRSPCRTPCRNPIPGEGSATSVVATGSSCGLLGVTSTATRLVNRVTSPWLKAMSRSPRQGRPFPGARAHGGFRESDLPPCPCLRPPALRQPDPVAEMPSKVWSRAGLKR